MTVALWTMRYFSPEYELFETEDEAARMAVAWSERGECSVAGVQYDDGRYVDRADWAAFYQAGRDSERQYQEDKARWDALQKPPKRTISTPFEPRGHRLTLEVDADEPAWLGYAGIPFEALP